MWEVPLQSLCLVLRPLCINHKSSPIHGCEESMGAQRGTKVVPWCTLAALVGEMHKSGQSDVD